MAKPTPEGLKTPLQHAVQMRERGEKDEEQKSWLK